jgi:hypothetical protein
MHVPGRDIWSALMQRRVGSCHSDPTVLPPLALPGAFARLVACFSSCAIVCAWVQDSACFCLAARPSYGCKVRLRLFPGSCSDPQSVCWCSVESASSAWTDLTLFFQLKWPYCNCPAGVFPWIVALPHHGLSLHGRVLVEPSATPPQGVHYTIFT